MTEGAVIKDSVALEIHAAVRGFAQRRLGDAALADDIAQETLARLLRASAVSRPVDPTAFAFRIAHNLLNDHFRSRRGFEEVDADLPSTGADPEATLVARDELAAYERVLAAMPAMRRDVFLRRRVQGESCRTIAAHYGVSVKAVEKHISKALQDLSDAARRRA